MATPDATLAHALILHGRPALCGPDGVHRPLAPDAAHRLLVLIGLHPAGLARAMACTLLWPDAAPALARARLRKLIFGLSRRPLLRAAPLALEADLLCWRGSTDLQRATQCAQRGALAEALAITAAPLAEGFDDERGGSDWLGLHRERERQRWRERLVLALATPGALADGQALGWIDDALLAEPFDESLVRERLRLIARRDGPVAARQAYEQWSDRVRAEYGFGATFDLAPLLPAPAPTPSPAPAGPPLPQPATRFFGRTQELASLDALLPANPVAVGGARLVVLWGPPGIGKSRLALQWALQARAAGRDVARIDLEALDARAAEPPPPSPPPSPPPQPPGPGPATPAATLATPAGDEALATAIAAHCGLRPGDARQPLRGLGQQLGQRPGLVLVLDNADHRPGDRPLLERLLRDSPVRLLLTSRVRLGLAGETLLNIAGLDQHGTAPGRPDAPAPLSDAEQLLVDRAALGPPDAAARPQLQQLCRLAQGHPLVLELAARQARRRGLAWAAQRLQDDLDALAATEPDLPARQRSLRAAFDSVRATLVPTLRQALAALAPLRSDFDAALAATAIAQPQAEALLDALVDHSLLAFDPVQAHYRWHPFLREYALAELQADAARAASVRQALARHLAQRLSALTEARADPALLQRVARDWPHVLDAWRCVALTPAAPAAPDAPTEPTEPTEPGWRVLAEAVALHAEFSSQYRQGAAWLAPGPGLPALAAARLQLLQARLLHWVEGERALALLDRAEPVLRAAGDVAGQIGSLRLRGVVQWRRGQADAAVHTLQQALDLGRRQGQAEMRAIVLDGLGLALEALGRYPEAQACWREALALNRAGGSPYQAVQNCINLAIGRRPGEDEGAVALARQALDLARSIGYEQFVPHALATLAWAQINTGEAQAASASAQQARALAHDSGDRYVECWALALCSRAALASRQQASGRAGAAVAAAAEWAAQGLALAQAIDDLPLLLQHAAAAVDWACAAGHQDAAAALGAACASHPALHARLRTELAQRLGLAPAPAAPGAAPWPAAELLRSAATLLARPQRPITGPKVS